MKNIMYLYSSQLVSVGFSILISLYIPRFIGVEEFSYWQLFLFYANYTGMLHLGLNDGLYLRLGGKKLTQEECRDVSSQLWIATAIISLICLIASVVIYTGIVDRYINSNLKFIFISVAFFAIINNIFGYCGNVSQALNRFKVFSSSYIIERIIMAVLLSVMILLSIKNFEYIVIGWIISLLAVTIWILFENRDLFLNGIIITKHIFHEIGINIRVGINLMLSNVSSMLIIGICRFFISEHYPIETFGFVSFSLSLCLFGMTFISKIGMGIYPLLKQKNEEFHNTFFEKIDSLLSIILPLCIILFPILIFIVNRFLPNYSPSLGYLAIFFPLCIFTAKIDMLYSTYLKVLRKERYLLKINIYIMILSTIISVLGIYVLNNIIITLVGVCACVIVKSCCMQFHIRKKLNVTSSTSTTMIDIIISTAYLALLCIGIDYNILIYAMMVASLVILYFHRRSVRENTNFIFIAKKEK